MIINEWSPKFKRQYGSSFPASYICFDTEFTGNSQDTDLVLEIGHVAVKDNVVVDNRSFILNWYKAGVAPSWLNYKLNNLRGIVGAGWRLLPDVVKQEGQDPITVLNFYHELFAVYKQQSIPFVAQNGIWMDEKMLRSNFNRYLNRGFELPVSNYFDTGLIFKATRVWEANSQFSRYKSIMLPVAGETLRDYFLRVAGTKITGLKWNLSSILGFYDLYRTHSIKADSLHSAGYDAMCLHYIMQQYRALVQDDPPKVTETPAETLAPVARPPLCAAELSEYIDKEIQAIKNENELKQVAKFAVPPTINRPARTTPAVSPAQRRKQRPV
jgi:hypothetical protein